MKRKGKQEWEAGDVFLLRQNDGLCSIGQVLDHIMVNVASCAFYDIRVPCSQSGSSFFLEEGKLIAAISVTREQLDRADWKVLGRQAIDLDRSVWPNENCRHQLWVGAIVYDASIAEELLNAYYGLVPWDDWHDPKFLDNLLVDPSRKPVHLMYKRQ